MFLLRIDEPRWIVWTSPLDWVSACRVAALHRRCGCQAVVVIADRGRRRLLAELLATAPREDQGTMTLAAKTPAANVTCRYVKVWKAEHLPDESALSATSAVQKTTADDAEDAEMEAGYLPGAEPLPPQHEPEEWDLDDVVGLPDVPPGKEASGE